jgi:hypothetical protein
MYAQGLCVVLLLASFAVTQIVGDEEKERIEEVKQHSWQRVIELEEKKALKN